ncbi:MAG: hypothetical protein H7Z72_19435, partial [Bacteroidetes bacterium]|nr:hypothetical protein [Fibrella sp.]
MSSFQSFLKIDGKEYDILYSDLGLGQAVDSLGRPASAVYGGTTTIELHTPANDPTLYEWMINPEKRMDGQVILRRLDSRATLKSIKFYNAYCVGMVIRFDGTANASSFKTTIRISPEQIEIGGLLHDNCWPDENPIRQIANGPVPERENRNQGAAQAPEAETILASGVDMSSREGAYLGTQRFPYGTVGYGVHASIASIRGIFGGLGEARIGDLFNRPDVQALLALEDTPENNRRVAELEYQYWVDIYNDPTQSTRNTAGGFAGSSVSPGARVR